ncbi:pfs domain-containing protein [Lasiodiplodia theobromae]|uniref:Pfs domain-containing protein n=1 Tax=Lasiodiplodia theobromae TaxID=45133 RepID=A0A8H7IQQ3_9PEZI|nr:pfs domain-containing protein [Lasiodiplodia theobromae]
MKGPSTSEDVTVRPECNVDARGHKRVNDDEADAQNPTKKQKNDHGAALGMNEWEEARQPTSRSKDICLYFYFDFTENQKQSLENTLRSLVSQLRSKEKDLESDLDSLYSSCDNGNRQPSIESLRKTFLSMIGKVGEVWIVIDALDECHTRMGNPNEGLLKWMDSLRSSQDVNIHFLVTSRPEQDIQSAIDKWTSKTDARIVSISIESDRTAEDIQDYVRARVTKSEGLSRWRSRPDIQNDIQTTLTNKAHGM